MRQKITMNFQKKASVEERFQQFLSNCAARGLSEKTIRGYKNHLHCLSKYLDIATPLSTLTKSAVEMAVAHMRREELSPNSICSYFRTFKVFLSWCKEEGYADITIPAYKPILMKNWRSCWRNLPQTVPSVNIAAGLWFNFCWTVGAERPQSAIFKIEMLIWKAGRSFSATQKPEKYKLSPFAQHW